MNPKVLTVYYSWSNGNTRHVAEQLQQAVGGDLEEIETVTPYTGSYDEVVAQAQAEVRRGYAPPIRALAHNPQDYDVIAVGTPTWWYTMAPAVKTFLKSQDFSGKTLVPFMTNAGWPGTVLKDMARSARGAQTVCPKEIRFDSSGGDRMVTPARELKEWLEEVRQSI